MSFLRKVNHLTRIALKNSLAFIVAFKVKSVANSINDIYTAVRVAYTFRFLTFSMFLRESGKRVNAK